MPFFPLEQKKLIHCWLLFHHKQTSYMLYLDFETTNWTCWLLKSSGMTSIFKEFECMVKKNNRRTTTSSTSISLPLKYIQNKASSHYCHCRHLGPWDPCVCYLVDFHTHPVNRINNTIPILQIRKKAQAYRGIPTLVEIYSVSFSSSLLHMTQLISVKVM